VTEGGPAADPGLQADDFARQAQEVAGVGAFMLDAATREAIGFSRTAVEILDLDPAAGDLPALARARIHPDDRDRVFQAMERTRVEGVPFDLDHRIVRASDGRIRWIRGRAELIGGRVVGTLLDITEPIESKRVLARAQEIAHLGLWERDLASGALTSSDELRRILGLDPSRPGPLGAAPAARLSWPDLVDRVHPEDRARFESVAAAALAGDGRFRLEHRVVHPDGTVRIIDSHGEAELIGGARPARLLGVMVDVTERSTAQRRLRRSEERFRRLADEAPVGIFETDANGSCLWVNHRWCEISGLTPEQAIGLGWVAALHPDDRAEMLERWTRGTAARPPLTCEYRLRGPDGRVAHVMGRATPLVEEHGGISGYLGTVTDVSDRERRERERRGLRRVATALAAEAAPADVFALVAAQAGEVLEAYAAGIAQFDPSGESATVVGGWCTRGDEVELGAHMPVLPEGILDRARGAGVPATSTVHAEAVALFGHGVGSGVDGLAAAPVWLGRRLWGVVGVGAAGGLPPGAEEGLQRFADLVGLALTGADARRQLARLASTDHLTGLPNRRSFEERLASEVTRARRHDRQLALVVLDIDNFKQINDAWGHDVGDQALVEFAERLGTLARAGETLARIGGEEFAWILPESDAMGGIAAAERARRAIGGTPFPAVGDVTVSGGVCDLAQAETSRELFRYADVALYWAKSQGRDAVFRYSPEVVELLSAEEQAHRIRRAEALSGIRALANAVDAKDSATQRHSERVADLAEALAAARGWGPERIARLREAALVHDVGKIGVRDMVLLKPARLTPAEYDEVRQHARLGARMVEGLLSDEQVGWVLGHHERWDGAGYPDGLAGASIPEGARILSLADALDAMVMARPHSPGLRVSDAVDEARRCAGSQFNPGLVETLEELASSDLLPGLFVPAADGDMRDETAAPPG